MVLGSRCPTDREDHPTVPESKKRKNRRGAQSSPQGEAERTASSPFRAEPEVEQLEFEGFSHEDAVAAADACGADWNEQAAKKAESYLSFTDMSRSRLIDQLEYEGFTSEQAAYGADAVGK